MDEKDEVLECARQVSEEFCRLEKEHRDLDNQIENTFGGKKFLTPEEDIEKKSLQKLKLSKKDRMQQIIAELKATVK